MSSHHVPDYRKPYPNVARGCWYVPLTQGRVALIDEVDSHRVGLHKWIFVAEAGTSRGARSVPDHLLRRPLSLGRFILNARAGSVTIHINGDTLDCRRSNLRTGTRAQLAAHNPKSDRKSSVYKGVSWDGKRKLWRVLITIDGKVRTVGRYPEERVAARAYDAAARVQFGQFAWLNFPDLK